MTWLTPSTSIPRAAMSVATSTRNVPARNRCNARSRELLRLVAVNGVGLKAALRELPRDLVGPVFGASEDQHAVEIGLAKQIAEQRLFVRLLHEHHTLLDEIDRRSRGRHVHTHRVGQQAVRQVGDGLGHGGREEQRLSLVWQPRDDLLEIGQKAHVEHPVGFVEDKDFQLVEPHVALTHEVEQSTRRGNEQMHAACKRADLRRLPHAAKDNCLAEMHVLPVGGEARADLCSQLARGREHQHAWGARRGRTPVLIESLQDRQGKRRGLAGAGLGTAEQITAGQQVRNRRRLDRRRCGVLLCCKRPLKRFDELKFLKRVHVQKKFLCVPNAVTVCGGRVQRRQFRENG